jgi:hypothetical protein
MMVLEGNEIDRQKYLGSVSRCMGKFGRKRGFLQEHHENKSPQNECIINGSKRTVVAFAAAPSRSAAAAGHSTSCANHILWLVVVV